MSLSLKVIECLGRAPPAYPVFMGLLASGMGEATPFLLLVGLCSLLELPGMSFPFLSFLRFKLTSKGFLYFEVFNMLLTPVGTYYYCCTFEGDAASAQMLVTGLYLPFLASSN